MHAPVAEPQIPRLRRVAMRAADELARPLRVVVRRIAIDLLLHAVDREDLPFVISAGVLRVLRPIPDDLVIPITSPARVVARVPLADVRGLVTAFAEDLRP